MDQIVEFLKQVNVAQIFVILVAIWFFYSRVDKKIEKLDMKIEKLGEKVDDLDRRLCRIEGSLSTHGHCLFTQAQTEKKAG